MNGRALFPKKRRILVQIATQVTCHESGLQVHQEADGCLLIEERMCDCFLLSLLPLGEQCFSSGVRHLDGPVFSDCEVVGLNLLTINQ